MSLKGYTFNLDKEKHKEMIEWIKNQQENGDLNFSALIRRLLKNEIDKHKQKSV